MIEINPSTHSICEYKLIVTSPDKLTKIVNELIREEWQPYGTPFKRGDDVAQAMVVVSNKPAC